MAALIKQANGYEMAKKPKMKKKERMVKERENFLKRKEGASNVSEQRDKGLDTCNPCTRYNPLSSDNNTAGATTPHKERMSGLVKHRDYPPHSYIINERYNSRNKRASEEKKQ